MKMKYDYLIVGAGLFGAVFAHEATKRGRKCLVVDKRDHVGGLVYTYEEEGINVHKYGAHVFNTSNPEVWEYIRRFAEFNRFTNTVIARYKDEQYNLPFNMHTFYQMWGCTTPRQARERISEQTSAYRNEAPKNLEEHVLSMVGHDLYVKLIKGYSEKQWGRPCRELPASVIARIPLRFTYDNNYYDTAYQGIPIGGYTRVINKMLEGSDVLTGTDFFSNKSELLPGAGSVLFTGKIDEYFGYHFGELEYRGLRFETETLPTDNYQGVAVVNYTDFDVPYTRVIEHKHFEFGTSDKTVVSREYPTRHSRGEDAFYPVNDRRNSELFDKYKALADGEQNVIFGGRLGSYQYTNMQDTILNALRCAQKSFGELHG